MSIGVHLFQWWFFKEPLYFSPLQSPSVALCWLSEQPRLSFGGLVFSAFLGWLLLGAVFLVCAAQLRALCCCQWCHSHPCALHVWLCNYLDFSHTFPPSTHQSGQVILSYHCKNLFHFSPFLLSLSQFRNLALYLKCCFGWGCSHHQHYSQTCTHTPSPSHVSDLQLSG